MYFIDIGADDKARMLKKLELNQVNKLSLYARLLLWLTQRKSWRKLGITVTVCPVLPVELLKELKREKC